MGRSSGQRVRGDAQAPWRSEDAREACNILAPESIPSRRQLEGSRVNANMRLRWR